MSQPESDMMSRIKIASIHDVEYENLLNKMLKDEVNLNGRGFKVEQKGLIFFKGRVYMPNVVGLKLFNRNEMHKPHYEGNPGYQKMIASLRKKLF